MFLSLLGGLAWLTQLRADIAVYVVALQRRMIEPTLIHVKRCNRILSHCKRHRRHLRHVRVAGNLRIVGVSDSAYKVEEDATNALVGHFILLMGDSSNSTRVKSSRPLTPRNPFGTCNMIDYACRNQKRVCRSTFAAEIRVLNDTVEQARIIQLGFE